MKTHFWVCYVMVILWVCYGYPMVLTAIYTIILITDFKKGAPHRCPFVVFYARISGIDPHTKYRIYSILQKNTEIFGTFKIIYYLCKRNSHFVCRYPYGP